MGKLDFEEILVKNKVKQKLKQGKAVMGALVTVNDPLTLHVMANAGFDYLLVDTQHSVIGTESNFRVCLTWKSQFKTLTVDEIPEKNFTRTHGNCGHLTVLREGNAVCCIDCRSHGIPFWIVRGEIPTLDFPVVTARNQEVTSGTELN